MTISLILAMDQNRVIGNLGQLPWYLPADLKFFKATTLGKPIIMGRKTFDSIGKPLPGRKNIVLTRDTAFQAEGCIVVDSVEAALKAADGSEEIMIIGGEAIFRLFLPFAHRIYLTVIEHTFIGDTFFPELEQGWQMISEDPQLPDQKNPYAYKFILLERT